MKLNAINSFCSNSFCYCCLQRPWISVKRLTNRKQLKNTRWNGIEVYADDDDNDQGLSDLKARLPHTIHVCVWKEKQLIHVGSCSPKWWWWDKCWEKKTRTHARTPGLPHQNNQQTHRHRHDQRICVCMKKKKTNQRKWRWLLINFFNPTCEMGELNLKINESSNVHAISL